MYLKIDDYTDFTLEIDRVHKDAKDIYDRWCEVTLVIENEYFTYKNYKNEMLLECEIQSLIRDLNSLLNCKLKEKQEIDFMEPDLEFVLWPSNERSDVLVDMKINLFQNHGLSADYYNLCLDEKEITKILKYLNSVIPTVNLLNENDNDENKEEVEKRDEYCVVSVKYDDYDGESAIQYFSIIYVDAVSKKWTFYPDYIVQDNEGYTWIIETKGGENSEGESKNIDIKVENKFGVLKNYAEKHNLKWGFVRDYDKNDSLYICNTDYTEDMSGNNWIKLEEML